MIDHARQIASKTGLEKDVTEGRKHTKVAILWHTRIVAVFFISRTSDERGADYLKRQLYLNERGVLDLARCAKTADQYYDDLRAKNLLPVDN